MKRFNLLSVTVAMLITLLSACSSYQEEPLMPEARSTTRSEIKETRTYSISEVRMIAAKALNKKPAAMLRSTVTPVMAQSNSQELALLSDTVAYVVNYTGNNGFAVVANDSRVEEPLAYSSTGNFSEENLSAKYFFLDNIEHYLSSLNAVNEKVDDNYTDTTVPVRRLIVEPRIEVELGAFAPFNKLLEAEHPNGQVGLMNVAAGSIISHSLDKLTWNNYYYNFESINYALLQGPGFGPIDGDIAMPNVLNPFPPITFIYSYDGSVAAYNQLFYDVGKATKTYYTPEGGTITGPENVYQLYESLGLTMSEIYKDNDIETVTSLLYDSYLIHVSGFLRVEGGGWFEMPVFKYWDGWVIDGCNVIIGSDNKIKSGEVHIRWGVEDGLCDGFFSYPLIIGNEIMHLDTFEYVGVKK